MAAGQSGGVGASGRGRLVACRRDGGTKMNNIILFILYLIFVLLIVAGFGIIIHKALQLLLMFLVELFSFDEKGDE